VITYEVTVTVRDELRTRFEVYMRERHIPDVLLTGLFSGAQLLRADDGRLRTRYELLDRNALERYLATHATRLRADIAAHFPDGLEFEREVWASLVEWPH